jgi:VanZ family protein
MGSGRGYTGAFRVALVGALAAFTWLSVYSLPDPLAPPDKLSHVLAYLVLGFLADLSFPRLSYILVKAPLLVVYGAAIELLQPQFINRSGEWQDLATNLVGLGLYAMMIPVVRRMSIWKAGEEGRGKKRE